MKYKYFGKTGIKVFELRFGSMSFGANADKENSRAMYKQVRDAGVNFFDCANVYQKGVAEEYPGEFIKGALIAPLRLGPLIFSLKTV